MTRLTRALTALLTLLALVAVAPPAQAADNWRITRYDTVVNVNADGDADVTVNFDFDFGNDEGHGPIVALVERQPVGDNPDLWRMIDITLGPVSSPSGAPANVKTESDEGVLMIRIGDENKEVRGVQSYTLNYKAHGLIATEQAQSGLDEFNFSVIGTGWEVPIANATATVNGPAGISQVACFFGSSYDQPCTAQQAGSSATFSAPDLRAGQGMQIVAGFPAGTFTDAAEPHFTKRYHLGNTFIANPATLGTAGAITLAGLVFVVGGWLRRRRDEVYVGLTPGLSPAPGQQTATKLTNQAQPVTVAFTPPKGVTPGEIGVLQDGSADNSDVTATILDLAARGYFQIIQEGEKDWRFEKRAKPDSELNDSERFILSKLFRKGSTSVTTHDLKDEKYGKLLPGGKERLDKVVVERGWFRTDLTKQRVRQVVIGLALLLIGIGLAIPLALTIGWGLVGVAVALIGVLALALAFGGRGRSAEGSAVLAQAQGFKQYLTTAEADQIKFEEGIDVFSRYLPYAMVFGVADRWTKLFEQLAAEGRYTPTDWYVGYGPWTTWNMVGMMNGLSSSISSAMASSVAANAATSASSGGSGFSGGGGFGGGGGGGW